MVYLKISMKRTIKIILLISIVFVGLVSFVLKGTDKEELKVYVEVKFSDDNIQFTKVNWQEDMTALEALQYAKTVETHPVGEYVFVSRIDSAKNIRGEKAWYYKINGKSPAKLAIWIEVEAGDTITWIYKQDVCSKSKYDCK